MIIAGRSCRGVFPIKNCIGKMNPTETKISAFLDTIQNLGDSVHVLVLIDNGPAFTIEHVGVGDSEGRHRVARIFDLLQSEPGYYTAPRK